MKEDSKILEEIEVLNQELQEFRECQEKRQEQIKELKEKRQRTLKRKIKRFFKYSSLLITTSTIIIVSKELKDNISLQKNNYQTNKINLTSQEKGIDSSNKEELTNNRTYLLNAILNNKKLTNQEKSLLKKIKPIILEAPYINCEKAYFHLLNLDVEYEAKDLSTIEGKYYYNENLIKIFNDNKNNSALLHEFIHCLFVTEETSNLPTYLIEGLTEILSNEYFSDTPFLEENSYQYEITIVKELMELVGSDLIFKVYTTGDMQILEAALNKYEEVEKTKIFLNNLEDIFNDHHSQKKVSSEKVDNVINYLKDVSTKKFQVDGNIELLESLNYYTSLLNLLKEDNPKTEYLYHIIDNGLIAKAYFNQSLLENYNHINIVSYQTITTINSENNKVMFHS